MSERRRLNRIENQNGTELFCTLEINGKTMDAEVLDFNSFGIRIRLAEENVGLDALIDIPSVKVMYGTHVLGSFVSPTILRVRESRHEIVLIPNSQSRDAYVERAERSKIPYVLEPLLMGADPTRMKESLFFRLEDISITGFGAKCSLSNRHLLAGKTLENFTLILPGLGEVNCSFQISHVRPTDNHMHVGCRFKSLDSSSRKKIQNFLLLCMLTESRDVQVAEKAIQATGKLEHLIRIRRIDSDKDLRAVADLRFRAYKGANKLVENATIDDMMDDYDAEAMILGAFIGPRLVGTFRIIFGKDGMEFPFERFFPFPDIGIPRNQTVEVCKLAIDPSFQGSDILFRLFQTFAIETVPKRKFALLASTRSLARNYVGLGAKKIPGSCPHPVLPDEVLQLYLLEADKFNSGKMSALAWIAFAREVVDFMSRFGFTKRTRFPLLKYLIAPFEIGGKLVRKISRKIKGARRG